MNYTAIEIFEFLRMAFFELPSDHKDYDAFEAWAEYHLRDDAANLGCRELDLIAKLILEKSAFLGYFLRNLQPGAQHPTLPGVSW